MLNPMCRGGGFFRPQYLRIAWPNCCRRLVLLFSVALASLPAWVIWRVHRDPQARGVRVAPRWPHRNLATWVYASAADRGSQGAAPASRHLRKLSEECRKLFGTLLRNSVVVAGPDTSDASVTLKALKPTALGFLEEPLLCCVDVTTLSSRQKLALYQGSIGDLPR